MVSRPAFTNLASVLYRDYNTVGVPASLPYKPQKNLLRTYYGEIESFLADLYDKAPSELSSVGGTANAATAVATPAVDAYASGQSFWYTPTGTPSVKPYTLNISALGALNIADPDGADLDLGRMPPNRRYLIVNDGTKLRVLTGLVESLLFKVLDADDTGGQNVATAQPWFPTAGAITLPVGKYFFEGQLRTGRSAGVTSHTTSLLFAGGATYTIDWVADVNIGDTAAVATSTRVSAAVATATVVKAASTSATEQLLLTVRGRLDVTVAGTFIPQYIYSVAPGGAPTAQRGSYLILRPRPGGAATVGAWA